MFWRIALALGCCVIAALAACSDDPFVMNPDPLVPPQGDASVDGAADGATEAAPSPFGLDVRPKNATCRAPARPSDSAPIALQQAFPNVTFGGLETVEMAHPPGDTSRWFVALFPGFVVTFPTANPTGAATQVIDLAALAGIPVLNEGEGGLLGMAFHPKFAQNGWLFLSWTTDGGLSPHRMRSVVSRLTTTDGGLTWGDHKFIIGPFEQPDNDHKAGTVKFGPDGYLYLSFGDGGSVGDEYNHGQDTNGFFSKILRIDVDAPPVGKTYGIPDGNPFKNGGGEPATFAWGFRNPFRFSFDRETGDLWVGDVGQDTWEEVDLVKLGGNYGWPCREGTHPYDPMRCPPTATLLEPVIDYDHSAGRTSVTGGVVYRGSAIPALRGTYIFADSSTFDIATLTYDPTTGAPMKNVINTNGPRSIWVSFVEDDDGELYVVSLTGVIYKVVAAQAVPPSKFPQRLSETGCVDPADAKKPAAGVIPYDINAPFWSDGADKERFLAVPDGKTIAVGADGDFDFPAGSVLTKTFSLGGKRIETRLLVRHDDGGWAGYDYEWNDAQTDAVLLPSSKSKKIGTQTWSFPSRGQCTSCHTEAAGHTLGLELGQLNRERRYPSTSRTANQLTTLEHIGMFSAPLGRSADQLIVYPTPTGAGALEPRARSYLHANCSQCHRPGGPGRGGLDFRFGTSLAGTKACGAVPQAGDLGVTGAKVLAPGMPGQSIVSLRPHALGANRMPPLASNLVDQVGLSVLDGWITGLTACP